MPSFADKYGPWAVVAGGSEGLGRAFADLLAGHGVNLVLVAHEEAALEAAGAELGRQVEVVTVLADLATDGVQRTLEACGEREIGLLVANAAVAPRGSFLAADPDELRRAVRVNVEAPVLLAHALGQGMRDRGRGGIVLVSSLSSVQGTAVFSTYAGTKAFLRVQAEGLWAELRGTGVDVISVVPGTIDTPGLRASAPRGGPRPMPPADVAKAALARLADGPVVFPRARDHATAFVLGRLLSRRRGIRLVSSTTWRMYGRD